MSEYTSEHAAWNGEARKYHLSYGQYVAQVERHGTLPPPPKKRREVPNHDVVPTQECRECGITFALGKTKSGNLSTAKLCPDCLRKSWQMSGSKRHGNCSNMDICKQCGKEFPKIVDSRGYYRKRGICFECKPERAPRQYTENDFVGFCRECGLKFPKKLTKAGKLSATTLCNDCRGKAYSKTLLPPPEPEYIECACCGEMFPQPYDKRNHRLPRRICDKCKGTVKEKC